MYEVLEISLADTRRLYRYVQQGLYDAGFSLKGFEYPWIIASHEWQEGEKVLDVGAAYSPLPIHIRQTYGCEVWVADDFGISVGDTFWNRGKLPQEHVEKHPDVKFVLERLGNPTESSLPAGYFDVIYSSSALEHVPGEITAQVWKHMDLLLKPGGEMIHAVDLPFPSNRGLKWLLYAAVFELLHPFVPTNLKHKYHRGTPKTYARIALKEL
jgi:hypothetical protein